MSRHIVANVDDIPPGKRMLVNVKGREIGIFNVDGEYLAISNRCPHEGASLCKGRIVGLVESSEPGSYQFSRRGELLRCPWHGWEYDVKTGQSWYDPVHPRVRQYPVAIETGRVLVEDPDAPAPGFQKGPYVAETYPVSVDETYIVVEIPE